MDSSIGTTDDRMLPRSLAVHLTPFSTDGPFASEELGNLEQVQLVLVPSNGSLALADPG